MKERLTREDCINGFNRLKAKRGLVGIDGGEAYKSFMFMKLHGFNILIKALCDIPEMPEDIVMWIKREYHKRRNYYVQQENKKPMEESGIVRDGTGYRFMNFINTTIKALPLDKYNILWTQIGEGWRDACGNKEKEHEALDKGEILFKDLLKEVREESDVLD